MEILVYFYFIEKIFIITNYSLIIYYKVYRAISCIKVWLFYITNIFMEVYVLKIIGGILVIIGSTIRLIDKFLKEGGDKE